MALYNVGDVVIIRDFPAYVGWPYFPCEDNNSVKVVLTPEMRAKSGAKAEIIAVIDSNEFCDGKPATCYAVKFLGENPKPMTTSINYWAASMFVQSFNTDINPNELFEVLNDKV